MSTLAEPDTAFAAMLAASLHAVEAALRAHPALLSSSSSLRNALASLAAATSPAPEQPGASASAALIAMPHAPRAVRPWLSQAPPTDFDAIAPYVAQAGNRATANVFAQLSRFLRDDERVWRSISRERLGVFCRTRLAAAARAGDVKRCEFLLDHGADVNAHDTHGRSPLLEALAREHHPTAAFLRSRGALESAPFGGELNASWTIAVGAAGAPDTVWSLLPLECGRLAVGHTSGAINLADPSSGLVSRTLLGHNRNVMSLETLTHSLASFSIDGTLRVWSPATGQPETARNGLSDGGETKTALAVLRGGLLATGGCGRIVRLWEWFAPTAGRAASLVLVNELQHSSSVLSMVALPCGGLASGCADGQIALWSGGGARVASLGGGPAFGCVYTLDLLPSGLLAAGYSDTAHNAPDGGPSLVRLWDVGRCSLEAVSDTADSHTHWVVSLAALPDGRFLSGSFDGTMKVWSVPRGGGVQLMCSSTLSVPGAPKILALARLPNGCIVCGGTDGMVHVWR